MEWKNPRPVDRYVRSRIRMRRPRLGLSQEKLARAIGLSFQQVQKYEKGANRIESSRLQQIANVFQVPITFFFEGGPDQAKWQGPSLKCVTDFLGTPGGHALTKAFMQIKNAKVRRHIRNFVKTIAG